MESTTATTDRSDLAPHGASVHGTVLMSDPRLNSVHLPFPRRAEYREARRGVLGAEGAMTLAGERLLDPHDRPDRRRK